MPNFSAWPDRASRFVWQAMLCLMLVCTLAFCTPVRAQDSLSAQHLRLTLLMPPAQLYPEQTFQAGLDFQMDPGWHIYWINAGDSGEPPNVKWMLPKGVTAGELQYPPPQRLPLGPLMDFGYENEVVLPVTMHVAPGFHPGSTHAEILADVSWLVCQNVCLPGQGTLKITRETLPRAPAIPTVNIQAQQKIASFEAKMPQPLPRGDVARFQTTAKGFRLAVLLGHKETKAEFFPLDFTVIANAAPQPVEPLEKGVALSLTKDSSMQQAPKRLRGVLELGSGQAYLISALPGNLPASAMEQGSSLLPMLRAVLLALLGGMLLNLMPCVFPVLFIKGLALVQSSQHERKKMRAHGWVYTLGILVSFWAVVAVLLILRAAGQQLGWGFQFQSPLFLALMAMLLFFMGLSLAGQFEIGLTLTSAGGSLAQKQGYAGSFFTGVLAMVVATPCTAPFMGPAIGYALAHSAMTSFAVFTGVGLGLALPYLLLAYNPGWTRLLPKPGAWMEILKQAVSIPIFGTVIWMVWLYTESAGSYALVALLSALLLLAIAGWTLGRWPAKRVATLVALLIIAAAIALPWYVGRVLGDSTPQTKTAASRAAAQTEWQPYSPALLQQYLSEGKPVFVDFTADWCLSCQVNQRVVLDRDDVQKALKSSGVELLKADWTHHDKNISEALQQLGRSGIPTYALYSGQSGAPPQLLPEVLTPGIVFRALDSLPHTAAADTAKANSAAARN
jgi:thiol:disulfide interchange protein DsbD